MLFGMALFGIASTSNLLARYAAADVSRPEQRGRAMGLIVGGSALGSIIGPNLMAPALALGARLDIPATASPFLVSVAGYGVAAVLTVLFLRPDPLALARRDAAEADAGRPAGLARSLGAILADVRVQIALATLSISQFVMISTTSTSPLYLHDQGHTVGTIGIAVSLHLAGMYVASPLSGWLADRFGRMPVIAAGALMLIFAVALAGLAPGQAGATIIVGPVPQRSRLEPRLRLRQRAPHRRALARRARLGPGPGRSLHGPDGRDRLGGGRDDPRASGASRS